MLKLITLDINNTILKFKSPPSLIYCSTAAKYNISIRPEVLDICLRLSLESQLKISPLFGSGTAGGWQNWWNCVVTNTFKGTELKHEQFQHLSSISEDLLNFYSTKEAYSLLPESDKFLKFLTSTPCIIGALTNTDPRILNVLKEHELDKYFDFVLDAYTAGVAKPNSEIFNKAIQLSELKELNPTDCLHIGDSLDKDYLAAKNANWKAFLLNKNLEKICSKAKLEVDENCMFRSLENLHLPISQLLSQ